MRNAHGWRGCVRFPIGRWGRRSGGELRQEASEKAGLVAPRRRLPGVGPWFMSCVTGPMQNLALPPPQPPPVRRFRRESVPYDSI